MNLSSSSWKEFSLSAAFLLAQAIAFWLWHGVAPAMAAGDFSQYRMFIAPVCMLTLAAALFSLAALLVRRAALRSAIVVGGGLVPFVLAIPATGIALGVMLFTLLLLWQANAAIYKEMAASLQYRIPRFLKQGLGFYFTAAALVISLFYLNRIDDRRVFSLLFPRPLFDFVLRSFSGTIQGATGLPQIRPEQTVDEIVTEMIRMQAQARGIELEKIPKSELGRMIASQRDEIAKNYGISIRGGERIGAVFADAVTSKVKNLVGAYNRYLPLGAAIVFFFMLKTISVIPYFFAILLAVLLMKLLILANVVKKEKEQIEVERLVL